MEALGANAPTAGRPLLAMLAASLGLGATCPQPAPAKVDTTAVALPVKVGFDSKDQACWPPGTSGVVSFTATPVALTGADGADADQLATCPLPQYAEQVRDPESGLRRYVCQCQATIPGLRLGTWQVLSSGPAGAGWCLVDLSAPFSRPVTIWHGICRQ